MKRIAYLVVATLMTLVVLVWLVGFLRGYLDARSDSTQETKGSVSVLQG